MREGGWVGGEGLASTTRTYAALSCVKLRATGRGLIVGGVDGGVGGGEESDAYFTGEYVCVGIGGGVVTTFCVLE